MYYYMLSKRISVVRVSASVVPGLSFSSRHCIFRHSSSSKSLLKFRLNVPLASGRPTQRIPTHSTDRHTPHSPHHTCNVIHSSPHQKRTDVVNQFWCTLPPKRQLFVVWTTVDCQNQTSNLYQSCNVCTVHIAKCHNVTTLWVLCM